MASQTRLEEVIGVKGPEPWKQGGHSSATPFGLMLGATSSQHPQLWVTQGLRGNNSELLHVSLYLSSGCYNRIA